MREIKFRAWDGKIMWLSNTEDRFNKVLDKKFRQNLMLTMDGEIRICHWSDSGVTMHDFGVENYKLMQFVGLLDKNETEIYEGDIVRINYPSSPVEGVAEFYTDYEEEHLAIRWVKWVLVDYKKRTGNDAAQVSYHFSSQELREVIGNIHENPELL